MYIIIHLPQLTLSIVTNAYQLSIQSFTQVFIEHLGYVRYCSRLCGAIVGTKRSSLLHYKYISP